MIDLKEDDPTYVEAMLRSVYTGDYSDQFEDPKVGNVYVYALGDKYDIETLKQLALE